MKKEVIIAIIAGLILGLIITVGIYTANRSLNAQKNKKITQSQPLPTAIPNAASEKSLNITSHENFDLVDEPQVAISGVAWPKAVVALLSEKDSQMTEADEEGIFSFTTTLIKGFNEITLIAADDTATTKTQNLVLTYSTTAIELPEEKDEAN
jgi:hypothetical protein